ncbi:PilN domain-containing protein [Loktanella sp. Alg231-35]|uniref:PilN domain-containing protein n=1 Tax=Loktanella sp. Alg231-35 TaxID=1922220 RepID=UPI00131EF12F|nr:PilN domain-containing protein [Loktanella sp. Alg231-35]
MLRFDGIPARGIIHESISVLTTQGNVAGRRNVDVVLPQEILLERSIEIPPTAVSKHRAIAELNLLRRTPFNLSEVHWVLSGDATSKSDVLCQWVAKRSDLSHYRNMLLSHGYRVRRFVVAGQKGQAVLADFTSDVAPRAATWRRMNVLLLIGAIGAGLLLWLQPAWQAKIEADRQLAARDTLRSEAVALRTKIEALKGLDTARAAFIENVFERPKLVDALHQMTVALPDHVWVSDVEFVAEQILINGETSQSAAALVLELTDAGLPFEPALSGSVSRTAEGKERFGIVFNANGSRQ